MVLQELCAFSADAREECNVYIAAGSPPCEVATPRYQSLGISERAVVLF